ncbi:MAG: silent information regulator protein Sir2 [Phycisphaerae bacterium]|nr:silent information regulator protein Sir2 [Saprospiraceae bacterium]
MPVDLATNLAKTRQLIASSSNIVVLTGAGVSTFSGIPDFRSPGSGLYDNLQRYKLPYPEAIFELDYFLEHPEPFFDLAAELVSDKYQPSAGHFFVRHLELSNKLKRLYTQNIDGLDLKAGTEAVIECHGSFSSAHCVRCDRQYLGSEIKKSIIEKKIPRCNCGGLIKPDIVFFGEGLPNQFHTNYAADLEACDLLLAMGSSLVVQPVGSLPTMVRKGIPRILINRERTSAHFDIELLGEIGEICAALNEKPL